MENLADFERVPQALCAALCAIPTAVLADAMNGAGVLDAAIGPAFAGAQLGGPAFTLRCPPGDNLTLHLALGLARPGDVLVVDGEGYLQIALCGELIALSARQRLLAGIVIDGAVRDRSALPEVGLPIFARGYVPTGPIKLRRGIIAAPISCGGRYVAPGDVIVGDADGVVVVPRAAASAVLAQAQAKLADEAQRRIDIMAGKLLSQSMGLDEPGAK